VVLVCNVTVVDSVKVPPLGVMVGVLTAVAGCMTNKVKLVAAWYCLFFPLTVIGYLPSTAEVEAVSVSWGEQSGVQEFGEKTPETPCGSPDTEKLMGHFFDAISVALTVVVADAPCIRETDAALESVKLDFWVDVVADIRVVSAEAKLVEVSEPWLESAGTA
jgi:hypothetical protein